MKTKSTRCPNCLAIMSAKIQYIHAKLIVICLDIHIHIQKYKPILCHRIDIEPGQGLIGGPERTVIALPLLLQLFITLRCAYGMEI